MRVLAAALQGVLYRLERHLRLLRTHPPRRLTSTTSLGVSVFDLEGLVITLQMAIHR